MSVAGVFGLFRGPQGYAGDDGRMALADHLRELRARLLRSVVVLVVAIAVALFFYNDLLELIYRPYYTAMRQLGASTKSIASVSGIGGPLLLQLKLSGLAAVVATSPYWLYQIWAFIVPGLHAHEKRWTRLFAAVAGPLFLVGVGVGYYVLPKGLQVLIGFTPARLTNIIDFTEYFSFMTRMLLVFGISFEIPVFVVLLNLAGIVPGRALATYRPWIVVATFVFAAVATPSTDPFSMLMLALPMTLLFLVSEVIARTVDRRRGRDSYDAFDDDEVSPIESPGGVRRSRLDPDED